MRRVHRSGQVENRLDAQVAGDQVEHVKVVAAGVTAGGSPDGIVKLDTGSRHEGVVGIQPVSDRAGLASVRRRFLVGHPREGIDPRPQPQAIGQSAGGDDDPQPADAARWPPPAQGVNDHLEASETRISSMASAPTTAPPASRKD